MLNFADVNIWYLDVHFPDRYDNKPTYYTLNETRISVPNVTFKPS